MIQFNLSEEEGWAGEGRGAMARPTEEKIGLTNSSDLDEVSELSGLAVDLHVVVQVLLEAGDVKDAVLGGLSAVDRVDGLGNLLAGRRLGELGGVDLGLRRRKKQRVSRNEKKRKQGKRKAAHHFSGRVWSVGGCAGTLLAMFSNSDALEKPKRQSGQPTRATSRKQRKRRAYDGGGCRWRRRRGWSWAEFLDFLQRPKYSNSDSPILEKLAAATETVPGLPPQTPTILKMASMPVVPMSVAQAQVAGDYQIKSEAALPVLGASDPSLRACSLVSAHDDASLRARPCLPASPAHI